MLKEKDLFDGKRIRFQNGSGITLESVVAAVKNKAYENAVPIACYSDQIKFGGLIGGSTENCVVFYHPQHQKDYFNFVVRVSRKERYAFLAVDTIGSSKMGGKINLKETRKEATRGESLSYKVGYNITASLMSLGANRSKMEQEQDWYNMFEDILEDITN